jgi:hypothetical protein
MNNLKKLDVNLSVITRTGFPGFYAVFQPKNAENSLKIALFAALFPAFQASSGTGSSIRNTRARLAAPVYSRKA